MNELDKRAIAVDRTTKRINHVPVPIYSKSANDPEGNYAGRLAKEIARLRTLPPEPFYSDLHQSVLRSRPFTITSWGDRRPAGPVMSSLLCGLFPQYLPWNRH